MVSSFSRSKAKQVVAKPPARPTTPYDVAKAIPDYVHVPKGDKRLKHYGIPFDQLLAKLRVADSGLTPERLLEMLEQMRTEGRVEQGLFPTRMGSEQGWRNRR